MFSAHLSLAAVAPWMPGFEVPLGDCYGRSLRMCETSSQYTTVCLAFKSIFSFKKVALIINRLN